MKQLTGKYKNINQKIYIGEHLISNNDLLSNIIAGRNYVLIGTDTVLAVYFTTLRSALPDTCKGVINIKDGEESKNFINYEYVIGKLLEYKIHRNDVIIIVGGGMVGDLVGFCAATYLRGVKFISIPTTLLSMVDSSIGGKVAINHSKGKNLVGSFYPAEHVLVSIDTLSTLPNKIYIEGLSEIIKYGAIRDIELLHFLEINQPEIVAKQCDVLEEIMFRSIKHKLEVVENDEFEKGERKYLNFGHSFGHAIETLGGYIRYSHGQAVAMGMVMAANLSNDLKKEEIARLISLINSFGLPTNYPLLPKDRNAFLQAMRLDKKNTDNFNLILLKKIGQAYIANNFPESRLVDFLNNM